VFLGCIHAGFAVNDGFRASSGVPVIISGIRGAVSRDEDEDKKKGKKGGKK
jgi:hypothetical protein